MKDTNKDLGALKNFIEKKVKKIHLEEQLKNIDGELMHLNEEEAPNGEQSYQKNTYEAYESDLQEVAKALSEACQTLESAIIKQEAHAKRLPEVNARTNESSGAKDVLVDIYKEVKKAKLNTERRIY